jgi:hypothetical protein
MVALTCCSWVTHPVDHSSRSYGKLDYTPLVFVRLGQDSRICSHSDGTAKVDIFVTLRKLPPQEVVIVINEQHRTVLFGTEVKLSLPRVAVGSYLVEVFVDGYRKEPVALSFIVGYCAAAPQNKELYKRDGSGLKGFCPEPEPAEPCNCPETQGK